MAYNYNVTPPDFAGGIARGMQMASGINAQQQAKQVQSLSQAALGGDMEAFNQLAAIDPQRAAKLKQLTQTQQVEMPDMETIGGDLAVVQRLAKSGSSSLPQVLNSLVTKYQGTGLDAEIGRWAQSFMDNPEQAVAELDNTVNAFTKPEEKAKVGRYKMAENGLVFDSATGKVDVNPSLKMAMNAPSLGVGDRQSINKDITSLTKDTIGIHKTAKDLEKLSSNMSGPASIAMVFKFMKALDPTSVVREGEFATAENSAGVPEAIRNTYNKLMEGGRLGDQQVKSFVSTARDLANSAIDSSSLEITNYLNTYEDTLPKRFKSEIMKRIPEKFKTESSQPESKKPIFSPALNSEITEQQIQEIMQRGYSREEILNKLGVQ